jgi:hypothetical protein
LPDDFANSGERQPSYFGLKPRDFIGQRGVVIGTPHGFAIIVEAEGAE